MLTTAEKRPTGEGRKNHKRKTEQKENMKIQQKNNKRIARLNNFGARCSQTWKS